MLARGGRYARSWAFCQNSPILHVSGSNISNDSHGGQGWNKETNYPNYSHGPHLELAWIEPTNNNPRTCPPIQRPLSVFPDNPHNNHLTQNTPRYTHGPVSYPPQQHQWQQNPNLYYNYNNEPKRCTVISDYVLTRLI